MCKWLHGRLRKASVPESHLVSRAEWLSSRAQISDALLDISRPPLIVRSSAPTEDHVQSSQAGRYLSVGSVMTKEQLDSAIDAVFDSYDRAVLDDILFVQDMVTSVQCVGVAFSADLESGSPYLIINYAETNQTDVITSGRGSYSTWIALGQGRASPPLEALQPLPAVLAEIQDLCGIQNLDIEFAVGAEHIHVFQVREFKIKALVQPRAEALSAATQEAIDYIRELQNPARGLVGRSTVFGVMPDWNPAEIIGIKPRPLAVSMYRALVTDRNWSKRRGEYGYRALSDVPLLHEVLGCPYIDVRASFNSLVPAALSDEIAGDFIDAGLQRLADRRELHDKVEFSVLPTCYIFDLQDILADRFGGSLSKSYLANIAASLRDLTRRLLENWEKYDRDEWSLISQLKEQRELQSHKPILDRLMALLSDAATLGITPFVGFARRAFIAIDVLRSLVRTGAITQERFSALLASINTVSRRFQRDKMRLTIEELLIAYGHLRPGTYDITAPRYDKLPGIYLTTPTNAQASEPMPFSLQSSEAKAIDGYLSRLGADLGAEEFIQFIKAAIAAREETKLEFTKNISDALELIALFCEHQGFAREDASFLRLNDFSDTGLGRQEMGRLISARRADYATAWVAKVPMLVVEPEELWSFNYSEDQPNYTGTTTVIGKPVAWPTNEALDGVVLLIENADPGFDWIFGTNIAGFITMFGGPNSHMAIRAHELGMTAAIGAGPTLFNRWRVATLLRINPTVEKAEVIP